VLLKQIDEERRERWSIMRIQSAIIVNLFYKKTVAPDELFLLPGEEERSKHSGILNVDEKEALQTLFGKWDEYDRKELEKQKKKSNGA